MKKILGIALCLALASNAYAQQETAPAEPPVAASVIDQNETVVTPDVNATEAPSIGQASQIQATAGNCGCQQTSYVQRPNVFPNRTRVFAPTYRLFPRVNRVAPVYTNQTYNAPQRLFRGRLLGGFRR